MRVRFLLTDGGGVRLTGDYGAAPGSKCDLLFSASPPSIFFLPFQTRPQFSSCPTLQPQAEL